MEGVRRAAVWIAAVYWVCCLAYHVGVVVTRPGPLPGYVRAAWFALTVAAGAAVLGISRPAGWGGRDPAPRWYIPPLAAVALACGVWPVAVGDGVPDGPALQPESLSFTAPGGPSGYGPGRPLTAEELRRVAAWEGVVQTGLMACLSGMTLAGVLYFRQVRGTPGATPAGPLPPAFRFGEGGGEDGGRVGRLR